MLVADPAVVDAAAPDPTSIRLIVPKNDVDDPELSIVVPALNEEITIGQFVDWCLQGLEAAGIAGEILIIDSSSDRTAEIAVLRGARVLKTPKRGLGRAYIDAIPFIRGRYVLMGDADCTYDFRELQGFMDKFRAGYEFIMGSRFNGFIEDGAMPRLHRYFGTPLTTWILNTMYGTRFTDIHCGMRGIRLSALQRMGLASQSWEYASEMVLKSVHLHLRTAEVPVRFLKDTEGRVSHLVRSGWTTPWKAGWINLKAMFIYGADFFLMIPGFFLFLAGFVPMFLLSWGPITVATVTFSLNSMLLCLTAAIVGLQLFLIGVVAQSLYDGVGATRARWLAIFSYTRTTLATALVFVGGLALVAYFVIRFSEQGYRFDDRLIDANHHAIFGLFLMMSSIIVFVSTLILHAIALYVPIKDADQRTERRL